MSILIKTSHSTWVQIFFGVLAVYLGCILHISATEWLFLVFAIGLGKEFFDARRPSDRFDIGDLAGNVAGIALAGLAWRLFV